MSFDVKVKKLILAININDYKDLQKNLCKPFDGVAWMKEQGHQAIISDYAYDKIKKIIDEKVHHNFLISGQSYRTKDFAKQDYILTIVMSKNKELTNELKEIGKHLFLRSLSGEENIKCCLLYTSPSPRDQA